MAPYSKLSKEKLKTLKSDLEKQFEEIKKKGLHLDMSRGKPSKAQLDIGIGMMDVLTSESDLVSSERHVRYGFPRHDPRFHGQYALG